MLLVTELMNECMYDGHFLLLNCSSSTVLILNHHSATISVSVVAITQVNLG